MSAPEQRALVLNALWCLRWVFACSRRRCAPPSIGAGASPPAPGPCDQQAETEWRSQHRHTVSASGCGGGRVECVRSGRSVGVPEMSTNTTTLLFERFHPPREQLRSCWTRSQGQSSGVCYIPCCQCQMSCMTQGRATAGVMQFVHVVCCWHFAPVSGAGILGPESIMRLWARRFRASFFAWALRLARIFLLFSYSLETFLQCT
jgi:hypothetical protein